MQTTNLGVDGFNLDRFTSTIHSRCRDFLTDRSTPWATHPQFPAFFEVVASYVGEGKALRALGIYLGSYLGRKYHWTNAATPDSNGLRPTEPSFAHLDSDRLALDLGVAMELFQAAALIHDDFLDDADTRRGHPSAHVLTASKFGATYGPGGAVLSGDYLLTLSSQACFEAVKTTETAVACRVMEYFTDMCAEVSWGQFLDLTNEALDLTRAEAVRDAALDVYRLKSANYSVMRPLALGALSSVKDRTVVDLISQPGQFWGLAFQLRDDALDLCATSTTGKRRGGDLREGKRTVLLALTLQRCNAAEKQFICSCLGDPNLGSEQVERVAQIIGRCGAWDEHESLISRLTAEGEHLVRQAEQAAVVDAAGADLLRQFARLLTERTY